jgi:predicted esterase
MIEMTIELMRVMGEIFMTFVQMVKQGIAYFTKKPDKNKKKPGAGTAGAGGQNEVTPEEAQAAKKKGELIMIFTILGLACGVALMFPQVRHKLFGGNGNVIANLSGQVNVEAPRNDFPMGQYTTPSLFKKKKFLIEDNGIKREVFYYWYAPPNPNDVKLPVVVILHDKDGVSQAAIQLRATAVQKAYPSYLMIPLSPKEKIWDAPLRYTGQEFPKAGELKHPGASSLSLRDAIIVLASLTELHPIDDSRMYIIGCDTGGDGVLGALAHYAGVFAAGVSIGGKWSFADAPKLAKTPLFMIHGGNDKVVPPSAVGTLAQVIRGSGGKAAFYSEIRGVGHECESPYFYTSAVWNWMFSIKRPPKPAQPQAASTHP